jgi:lysozyme family protein
MANINKLIPLILKWEGGYVNDPADSGGPTKAGVTLKTWMAQGCDKDGDGDIDIDDLKLITRDDVINRILRPHYWNRWKADEIRSQALANILVDWVWGSGRYGITVPQGILAVKQDGIVGAKTIQALNNYPDQEALFDKIKQMRKAFFNMICINCPAKKRFLKGWLNRLEDFKWIPVLLLLLLPCSCKTSQKESKSRQFATETRDSLAVSFGQKVKGARQMDHLQLNTDEQLQIKSVTVWFDSFPDIRQINRTVLRTEKTASVENQKENLVSETENREEETMVAVNRQEENYSEAKEKPGLSGTRFWIAGIVVLAIVAGMVKLLR